MDKAHEMNQMEFVVDQKFPSFIGGFLGNEEREKYLEAIQRSRKIDKEPTWVYGAAISYMAGLTLHHGKQLMEKECAVNTRSATPSAAPAK